MTFGISLLILLTFSISWLICVLNEIHELSYVRSRIQALIMYLLTYMTWFKRSCCAFIDNDNSSLCLISCVALFCVVGCGLFSPTEFAVKLWHSNYIAAILDDQGLETESITRATKRAVALAKSKPNRDTRNMTLKSKRSPLVHCLFQSLCLYSS